jgi:bifunctional UDP-N-acetylglucosamine pyrophosphorylase/glucosamine-1-phosphate N-acetyltransferase
MRSATPKHLHPILGRRMVDWVIGLGSEFGADPLVVVASPDTADAYGDDVTVALQAEPLGTGHAVRSARAALEGARDVLVLSGDTPLLTVELLEGLVATHKETGAACTVLSFEPADPRSYGRIVRDDGGRLARIVEASDATDDELAIGEVNSSVYVFQGEHVWPALDRLEPHNAQGELYLTDTLALLVADGEAVAIHVAPDPRDIDGVNTRSDLASAASVLRDRINASHMEAGATIVDPATTWIEPTVELAADVVIEPFTALKGATRVGAGAHIGPHVVAVDSRVGEDALVGPFCYLRPGTVLEAGAKAGTFVELKNSRVGARTKVPHLSYLGDADVGEDTNIGAGAITVNLDHGRPGKNRTTIGSNVRTGVDNAFVAPVTIGDDAWTAAGSVITDDVPPNALAIARAKQVNKEGRGGKRDD